MKVRLTDYAGKWTVRGLERHLAAEVFHRDHPYSFKDRIAYEAWMAFACHRDASKPWPRAARRNP